MKSILESLFGPVETLEALVKAGQYLGAHGLRYAVDALRRRGKPHRRHHHLGFQRALAQWRRTLSGRL